MPITSKEGEKIIIKIDRDLCIGAATCTVIAPNTFGLDDEGKVVVLNPNGDSLEKILSAAESCPVIAILLQDKTGKSVYPKG